MNDKNTNVDSVCIKTNDFRIYKLDEPEYVKLNKEDVIFNKEACCIMVLEENIE